MQPDGDGTAEVLNEERPPGLIIPQLSDHPAIEVEARIVWSDGSQEWVRGHTTRWIRPVARVTLADGRRRYVWLSANDIRRVQASDDRDGTAEG